MAFRFFLTAVFCTIVSMVSAQQDIRGTSWVQIEARPSKERAAERADQLSQSFDNIRSFYLGSGWYGIALGPYDTRNQATTVLRNLRRAQSIPGDSFVASGNAFREQIWPALASVEIPEDEVAETPAPTEAPVEPDTTQQNTGDQDTATVTPQAPAEDAQPEVEIVIELPKEEPDETPNQARASERKLSELQKKDLQRALKFTGHYTGRIDGKYGKGTRRAMGLWQQARAYKTTGVLTKRQRAEVMEEYDAVLAGLTFADRSFPAAGIDVKVPEGVFAAEAFDAPFIRFEPNGDVDGKLILISQKADRDTMEVLFEVLKTLEIVPVVGRHRLTRDGFRIDGTSARWHTTGFADLRSGQLKGAVLVWPASDSARRDRIELEIFRSFKRTTGVLDVDAFGVEDDAVVLSGLPVRQPKFVQSGLFVDRKGHVLTAERGFGACSRIGVGAEAEAEVLESNGLLTVLKPIRPVTPIDVSVFQKSEPQTPSAVLVAGYSYGGLLGAPTLTFGQLRATSDLSGDASRARLEVDTLDGDIGGPVFDRGGAVVGVLLPQSEDPTRQLPGDVQFAALWPQMTDMLSTAKMKPKVTETLAVMHPEDISTMARDTTVVVTCWE